jgi:hypothetical protein
MLKSACASIALLALSNPALINPALAADCATPADAAALKIAVMQQELMVAALQCHETPAYNRFVLTYRNELQSSDAGLKAFFIRRGGEHGEAGYDAFKTKAANLSALEQARNTSAFCADAHALFAAAFANQGSLVSFVQSRSTATDIGNICVESRPSPVLARTDVKPEKVPASAAAKADVVKVAEVRPAEVAVGGVPAYSLPAIPYWRQNGAPPPKAQDDTVRGDDMDDTVPGYADEESAPPPPPPRYYQIRDRYYDGFAPRNYGPPPSWQQGWRDYPAPPPPPLYGWYPRAW